MADQKSMLVHTVMGDSLFLTFLKASQPLILQSHKTAFPETSCINHVQLIESNIHFLSAISKVVYTTLVHILHI